LKGGDVMKLEITRYTIQIIPAEYNRNEKELDVAFIEGILGLKKEGDSIKLIRHNASGLSCLAYLETEKQQA